MDTMTSDGSILLSSDPNDAFLCNVNQSTAAAASNSNSTTGDFGSITPAINETLGVKTIEIFENGVKRVIIVPVSILLPSSNVNSVGANVAVSSNGSANMHSAPNNILAAASRTLAFGTSSTPVTVSACSNSTMQVNSAVDVKNFARLLAIQQSTMSHVCSSTTSSQISVPQTVTAAQSCSQLNNTHPAFRSSSLSTLSANNLLVSSQCQTYGGLTLSHYNNRPNESVTRTQNQSNYFPGTSLAQGSTLAAGSYVPYSAANGTLPFANVSNNTMQLPYVQQLPIGQQNCVSLPSNTGLLQQTFSNSFVNADVAVNPQLINNGTYLQGLMPQAQVTMPWPNVQGSIPATNRWPLQFVQTVNHSPLNVNCPSVNTIQFVPSLPTGYNTAPTQLHTINYFQPSVQYITPSAPPPHVGQLSANTAVEFLGDLTRCADPAPVRLNFPAADRTSDQQANGPFPVRNNGATTGSQLTNCLYNFQRVSAADIHSQFPAAATHNSEANAFNFDRFNYFRNPSNVNVSAGKVPNQTLQPIMSISSASQQVQQPPGYFSQFRVCKNVTLPVLPSASSDVGMLGPASITRNGVHSAPAVRAIQQTSRRNTGRTTGNAGSRHQTGPTSVTIQSAVSAQVPALRAPPPLRMAVIRNSVKPSSAHSSTLGLASSVVVNAGIAGLNAMVARSLSDVPKLHANLPTDSTVSRSTAAIPVTAKAIMESAVGSPGGESSNDIGSIPPEVIEGAESEALLTSFCTLFDTPAQSSVEADRFPSKSNSSVSQPIQMEGIKASSVLPVMVATQSVAGVTAAEAARALSFAKSLGKGMHHAEQVKVRRQAKQTKRRRRSHLTSLEVNDESNSSDSWHPDTDSASISSYELSPGLYDDVVEEALSSSDSWSSQDSVTIGRSSRRSRKRSPEPRKRRSQSWRQSVRDQAVTRRLTRRRHSASPKHEFSKMPDCFVLLERLRLNGRLSVPMCLIDSVVCCPRTAVNRRIIDSDDETVEEQPSVKRTRIRIRVPCIEDTEIDSS